MEIKIGTFNLNNLFGRFNFKASIGGIKETGTYSFNAEDKYWIRKFRGKLVKPKNKKDTKRIAERILEADVDVLAVQEVEDRDTLRRFNKEYLKSKYPYQVVIDGNDIRLIDVGVLSRYPLRVIVSWQQYRDSKEPGNLIFSRDLLQVEILNKKTYKLLFTLFITHLKSKFVSPFLKGLALKQQIASDNAKRIKQSKAIVNIISKEMKYADNYIVAGDFNDTPNSKYLAPLLAKRNKLKLEDIVKRLPKDERWTATFKESHKPRIYEQIDFILSSPSLSKRVKDVEIGRRKVIKDGSDHDPVFAILDL